MELSEMREAINEGDISAMRIVQDTTGWTVEADSEELDDNECYELETVTGQIRRFASADTASNVIRSMGWTDLIELDSAQSDED